jgi:agmatinase
MTKEQKIATFDPNSCADKNAGVFGLPFTAEESTLVLVPVPWEVTVSYGGGTVNGPEAILEASYQVDLYDPYIKDAWKKGIAMDELNIDLKNRSEILRQQAENHISRLENGEEIDLTVLRSIQTECEKMNTWVEQRVLHFMDQGKVVGLVGGDHSTPLGMISALGKRHEHFGILQIDAHADLRDAYEGFAFSHASIMYNAVKLSQVNKLVQVGIRDYCEEEVNLINDSKGRIRTYFDRDIKQAQYSGKTWAAICADIVNELPQKVYLSFDIDGLDPKLCPNTGTPVAGGFETDEVLFLLEKVVESGREIIAFDLNEVSPAEDNDWDANVAARLLFRIGNLVVKSQGK